MSDWHIIEMRALEAHIWGVPGAPSSLMDLDPTVFFAFLEGLLRNDEKTAKELDRIWATNRPKKVAQTGTAKRASEIEAFINSVGA